MPGVFEALVQSSAIMASFRHVFFFLLLIDWHMGDRGIRTNFGKIRRRKTEMKSTTAYNLVTQKPRHLHSWYLNCPDKSKERAYSTYDGF